jgi:hypothetical protein
MLLNNPRMNESIKKSSSSPPPPSSGIRMSAFSGSKKFKCKNECLRRYAKHPASHKKACFV